MGAAGRIVLGSPPNSYYAVMDALIGRGLEALGHRVEVVADVHERIYPRFAAGELDLFVASVLPSAHSAYWPACEPVAVKLGRVFEDGRFAVAVPARLPPAIAGIADLADAPGDFDRGIATLGPGSGLTLRLLDAIQRYGLAGRGFHAVPGSEAEWTRHVVGAERAGRSFATILWRPCFMNRLVDLRPLADPLACMGGADTGWIVAHRAFAARAPAPTLAFLRRVEIGLDAVTAMDHRLAVEGATTTQAVDEWLAANARRFESWLGG